MWIIIWKHWTSMILKENSVSYWRCLYVLLHRHNNILVPMMNIAWTPRYLIVIVMIVTACYFRSNLIQFIVVLLCCEMKRFISISLWNRVNDFFFVEIIYFIVSFHGFWSLLITQIFFVKERRKNMKYLVIDPKMGNFSASLIFVSSCRKLIKFHS